MEDFGLVQVPHSLHKDYSSVTKHIFSLPSPYRSKKSFWNPWQFIVAKREANKIRFYKNDILVFQTESDPINLLLVENMRRAGGKVLFLAEGIASYSSNMPQEKIKLTWKNWVKKCYLKRLLGFDFINYSNPGRYFTLRTNDCNIDAAMFYFDVDFDRHIRKVVIANPERPFAELDKDVCIFLSQPLYDTHYFSQDEFIAVVETILPHLSSQFRQCIFRFHPRDSSAVMHRLSRMIARFGNIKIDEHKDLETSIKTHTPFYAASLFSAGILELAARGLTPIFLYKCVPSLLKHSAIKNIDDMLKAMHYQQVDSLDNLKSANNPLIIVDSPTLLDVLSSYNQGTSDEKN